MKWTLILIIAILAIILIIEEIQKNNAKQEKEIKNLNNLPYIRKNLMTKNEWAFYKGLKPVADKMNLTIIAKTRLADFVDIKKGISKSEWQTAFNRVNKKHIDFTLCKPENLFPVLLIELDDSSHNTDKVKARDEFVEKVLEQTGYKLLRVNGANGIEEKIKEMLNNAPEAVSHEQAKQITENDSHEESK